MPLRLNVSADRRRERSVLWLMLTYAASRDGGRSQSWNFAVGPESISRYGASPELLRRQPMMTQFNGKPSTPDIQSKPATGEPSNDSTNSYRDYSLSAVEKPIAESKANMEALNRQVGQIKKKKIILPHNKKKLKSLQLQIDEEGQGLKNLENQHELEIKGREGKLSTPFRLGIIQKDVDEANRRIEHFSHKAGLISRKGKPGKADGRKLKQLNAEIRNQADKLSDLEQNHALHSSVGKTSPT